MSSDQHRKKGDGARSSDSDGSEERKHYSEQGRHGKENVKRSNHDDERRRSSPKQPKHPSPTVAEKPLRREFATDANGQSSFKIPLKPNRDQRTKCDRPVISPLASSSRDVSTDRHSERSGVDRRHLATVNHRHDSWSRYDDRGLTKEQQRWLERMPRRW